MQRMDPGVAVPAAVGAALAAPVLLAHYPPMADLPLHEAVVGVLRHLGDPTFAPPALYRLNLGHPNQLFVLVAWLFAWPFSVTMACKLTIALAVALVPLAVGRAARYLGASPWAAALAAPLALGWAFYWGLAANLWGLVVFFGALPSLDRFASSPTTAGVRGVAAMTGLFLLSYLAHESITLVLGGTLLLFGAFATFGPSRAPLVTVGATVRSWAILVVPLVATALVVYLQLKLQVAYKPPNEMGEGGLASWDPPGARLLSMPYVIFGEVGQGPGLGLTALLAVALLYAAVHRRGEEVKGDARFGVLTALLVVGYFAFPSRLLGATLLHQRFLPPAVGLSAVLATRGLVGPRKPKLLLLLAAVVPVGCLAVGAGSFADAHFLYRDLDALLPSLERGSSVLELMAGIQPPRVFIPWTAQGHVVGVRGGRSVMDATRSPISAAVVDPAYRWDEPAMRTEVDPYRMIPRHDLRRFRYVLLHAYHPGTAMAFRRALAPETRFVAERGEWLLLESTLPQLPLLSPDAAVHATAADFLYGRVRQVIVEANPEDKALMMEGLGAAGGGSGGGADPPGHGHPN